MARSCSPYVVEDYLSSRILSRQKPDLDSLEVAIDKGCPGSEERPRSRSFVTAGSYVYFLRVTEWDPVTERYVQVYPLKKLSDFTFDLPEMAEITDPGTYIERLIDMGRFEETLLANY